MQPLQMLLRSARLEYECKISYDILGVHLTCNMGLIRETNGDKRGGNTIRIRVGGKGMP